MKKAMTVLLWLGLALCMILLASNIGQKNAYRQDLKNAQRKHEVLKNLYDQSKEEWEQTNAALTREMNSLTAENLLLSQALEKAEQEMKAQTEARQQDTAAFGQAREEWNAQRLSLEKERDAASGKLTDVLNLLLTPDDLQDARKAEEGRKSAPAATLSVPQSPLRPPMELKLAQ